jgi:type VI secretion system secreted protein VgrG
MSTPTQKFRVAQLKTPLGEDVLRLSHFTGREALSSLFDYRIEAVSKNGNLDLDKLLGAPSSIAYRTYDDAEQAERLRHFHGIVTEAEWLGAQYGEHLYRLTLRPWPHLLSFGSDCRFFKNSPVTKIITDVFNEAGFPDYELKLTKSYPNIEYCVQYRESHLNFVMRLMELNGIYFYFRHTADKHILVLADGLSSHQDIPELPRVPYKPLAEKAWRDRQHLSEWTPVRRLRTGKVSLNDYDYKKPSQALLVDETAHNKYSNSKIEFYDYHVQYDNQGAGKNFAKIKLEMAQSQDRRRITGGDAPSLFPGGLTTVFDHGEPAENQKYLVVAAQHTLEVESYRSGGGGGDEYKGSYEFLPATTPFRAPQVTPKPSIHGVQTAVVVGAEGEEIDVDEMGRILVQFHWDRKKQASRRVRVGQTWAHKDWGHIFIPRIGMEVIVEFVEGDPDHPLVMGCVYNGNNVPPWQLPAMKNTSGFKSRSTKNGSKETANVFAMVDTKDEEVMQLQAEKDWYQLVENKELVNIGEKFPHKSIIGDQTSASREVQLLNGDDYLAVKKGSRTTSVSGSHNESIGGDQTIDVKGKIKITAGVKIELICGASTIVMEPGSIKINSGDIKVDAPMTSVNGSATLKLTGGMVLIN